MLNIKEIFKKILSIISKFEKNNFIKNNELSVKLVNIIKTDLKRSFIESLKKQFFVNSNSVSMKEFGIKFKVDDKDKLFLKKILTSNLYPETFKNFSKSSSNFIKKEILKNLTDDRDLYKLKKNLKNKFKANINRIVRTETTRMRFASTINQLKRSNNNYLFKHIGIIDNRTAESTKEIIRLTKNMVTWSKYIELLKKVSLKYNGPKWIIYKNAPLVHCNQRSTFIYKRIK